MNGDKVRDIAAGMEMQSTESFLDNAYGAHGPSVSVLKQMDRIVINKKFDTNIKKS